MSKLTNEGFDFVGLQYQYVYNWPGGPSNEAEVTTIDRASIHYANHVDGIPNPNWRWQVARGFPATTPCSGYEFSVDELPYISAAIEVTLGSFAQQNRLVRLCTYTGNPSPWIAYAGIQTNNVDTNSLNQVTARVDSEFLEKAKSAISSFQSGQDIVELHQTLEAIIRPMSSLRKHISTYFQDLKKIKGRFQKIRNPRKRGLALSKALSDSYLEWTFGWKPLSLDVFAGIETLEKTTSNFSPIKVQSFAKIRYAGSLVEIPGNFIQSYLLGKMSVTSDYSIRLQGAVNAAYRGTQPTMQQELQLLPEDFAPTLWNVLPYSFVIDYFLNVGDIVDAYSFPFAALDWCNRSTRDITKCVIQFTCDFERARKEWTPTLGYTINRHECSGSNYATSSKLFTRSSLTASDLVPPLVIHLPPLSSKPWQNIAALVLGQKKLVTPFA
jgi:hypothetical protein